MRVEMTFGMIDAIGRRLVKAHRVREGNSENFVVSGSDAVKNVTQRSDFIGRVVLHASEVSATADQNLKRPDRPKGHEPHETIVLIHHADLLPLLQCNVVAEKTTIMRLQVGALGNQLFGRNLRNRKS